MSNERISEAELRAAESESKRTDFDCGPSAATPNSLPEPAVIGWIDELAACIFLADDLGDPDAGIESWYTADQMLAFREEGIRAALASPEPDFAGLANEIANGQERLGPEVEGIIANHLGDYLDDGDRPETITENPKSWAACLAEELARLASPDTAGWRPIESAPRDGTRVLLKADSTYVAGWTEGGNPAAKSWVMVNDCWVHENLVTHWMPLPAAPQPPKEGGT